MLGLSFSEIIVIVLVGICLIGPKDLPIVLKQARMMMCKLSSLKVELTKTFQSVLEDEDLKETYQDLSTQKNELKKLLGNDGKVYDAYDLDALKPYLNKPDLLNDCDVPLLKSKKVKESVE